MRTRWDMLADGLEQAGISVQRHTKWVREGRYESKIENFTIRVGSDGTIEVSNLYAYGRWVGWTVIRLDADNFVDRVILNRGKRVAEVVKALAAEISQEVTA